MKTIALALAAAAALGFAAPAFAHAPSAKERATVVRHDAKASDFSSRHWRRHHHRHCQTFWRHHRRVTVCRY